MTIKHDVPLAPLSSLGCGGSAELLAEVTTADDIKQAIAEAKQPPKYVLGFLTNALVSDQGLDSLTLMIREGEITVHGDELLVNAGVWWDDVVQKAIAENLWGIETMSGIPSSTGGAVVGNIAAYGQQASDCLSWIEMYDTSTNEVKTMTKADISFGYRESSLQTLPNLIVTKVVFKLSHEPTMEVRYDSALKAANDVQADMTTLEGRRKAILEARRKAGSLYEPGRTDSHTAGSFFKNPLVDEETAKHIASFDESGKSLERLLEQNKIHGGTTRRVSAAHVLLAAGFNRGQSWGNVRLHPNHVLKLENTGGARAQEIYDVAKIIVETVHEKLGITLEPEVKFIGSFN